MRARIGADEALLPVRGGTVGVVSLQRFAMVRPFVAKLAAKGLQRISAGDEPVPVVMANLVPEVARERSIGFVQRRPSPFSFRIVGFGEVDRDDSRGMPGQRIRFEFEGETAVW